MRCIRLGFVGVILQATAVLAAPATQISQYGITWTFNKAYEAGQFINGDWWVAGPCTVVAVFPAPVYGDSGRNGSMLNPVTGTQAYDDRIAAYNAGLGVAFPAALGANQSLVSSISLTTTNCTSGQGGGNLSLAGACIPYNNSRPMLKTAAVLTCVAAAPTQPVFRPGFCGAAKVYYPSDRIQWGILPGLQTVATTPALTYYNRGLERPWISHIGDWTSRSLHPMENMLDYHAKIFAFYQDVALLVLLDIPGRDTLVFRAIQNGIDMYAMVLLGHGGSGTAKWPILFAGLMLNDPQISGLFKDDRSLTPFREDWMSYYGSEGTSTLVSSMVAADRCWTGYTVPQGAHAGEAVLWRQDPGDAEHEHLHPAEWGPVPPSGGGCKHESYRCINSPNWAGMALSTMLLGGRERWDHPAYFDYVDRWMNEDMGPYVAIMKPYGGYCDGLSGYQSTGSAFANAMWATYRGRADSATGIRSTGQGQARTADIRVYPNPLRHQTVIFLQSGPTEGPVHLTVFNQDGDRVYTACVTEGFLQWNGKNLQGHAVAPGLYFYSISTGQGNICGKIIKTE